MDETAPDARSVVTPSLVRLSDLPEKKTACLETLLSVAADSGRVTDRDRAREVMFKRESAATTAMGDGVAVPHAKTDAVETPTVVFGRSGTGVEYETPDGEPVEIVLLLLVPGDATDAHLTLLSGLSRSLVDPRFRDRLKQAQTASTIVKALRGALCGENEESSGTASNKNK
jgi:fructose-specific phosphotransferase system IIA component